MLLTLAACAPESEAPKTLPPVESGDPVPAPEVKKPAAAETKETAAAAKSPAPPVAEKKSVELGPLGIMAPEAGCP